MTASPKLQRYLCHLLSFIIPCIIFVSTLQKIFLLFHLCIWLHRKVSYRAYLCRKCSWIILILFPPITWWILILPCTLFQRKLFVTISFWLGILLWYSGALYFLLGIHQEIRYKISFISSSILYVSVHRKETGRKIKGNNLWFARLQ